MAMPTQDAQLVSWGSNFDTKGTASPVTFALTATQMTSFHTAYQAFVTAYNAVATAREAGSRSKLLTSQKDQTKADLLVIGRELYSIVQSATSVTDANKLDIGVVVKKTSPTPIPAPSTPPGIAIVSTVGNTVQLRFYDVDRPTHRSRPPGVDGVSVFSFVGAVPPTDALGWHFEGVAGRTTVDVTFPSDTAAGAKVWFTAFWFNERKQNGPAATAIGINIPGGASMAA